MMNTGMHFIAAALLALACGYPAAAQSEEEAGRAIFEEHKNAVVTVQLVVNQRFSMQGMPSQENEAKVEAAGTVITPEGLTVLALSSTDPTSIVRNMMGGAGMQDFQMDSSVSDVTILLADGTEVDAEVILRDNDLDLAYVRPTAPPEEKFAYVDFTNSGAPELLDNVVTIARLGKVANRAYAASFERVQAIVERPRTFYIPGKEATQTATGSPAFTLDNKIIGLFVVRSIRDTGGGSSMFGGNENVTPIILPARDVLDGAEQVPAYEEDAGEEVAGEEDAGEEESAPEEEEAEEGEDGEETEGDGDAEEEAPETEEGVQAA